MFKTKIKTASIWATVLFLTLFSIGAYRSVEAQQTNPGVQQSGAVANNDCVLWGPGVGQVKSGGGTCGSLAPVQSVFGRAGNVIATLGDYSFSLISGTLSCAQLVALTGDITNTVGSCATTLATVNANVGAFGGVNSIPSFTVDAKGRITAAAANVPAIPFTQLTGSLACSQMPSLTGDTTSSAGSCANVNAKLNGVTYSASPATDTIPVITAANTATYAAMPNCTSGVIQYTTATHLFNCGSASVDPSFFPNYIGGLVTSFNTTAILNIAAGAANDSTNAQSIKLSSAFTKSTAGAWTSGTGSTGMGNGLTIAASTSYHVCLAYNAGTPDIYFDTSAVCANKPAGVSGTLYRRIASFRTNASSQIVNFIQNGNNFTIAGGPITTYNASSMGTGAITQVLSTTAGGIPAGVVMEAQFNASIDVAGAGAASGEQIYFSALNTTSVAAGGGTSTVGIFVNTAAASSSSYTRVVGIFTDTSNSIRSIAAVGSANTNLRLNVTGWKDLRGE